MLTLIDLPVVSVVLFVMGLFVESSRICVSCFCLKSAEAEGCAMSSAGDRQLFNRVVLDSFLHGKLEVNSNWRKDLVTPGCLVTDTK